MTMQQHFRLLGWLFLMFGIMGVLGILIASAAIGLISWGTGELVSQVPMPSGIEKDQSFDPLDVLPVITMQPALIIGLLASLSYIIPGIGLLRRKRWARTFVIIASILSLPGVPFWTALGVYGLWLMFNSDSLLAWEGYVA